MRVPLPEKASQPTVEFDAEEIEAILLHLENQQELILRILKRLEIEEKP